MNASATSDFSPPESSDRRLVVLPAGVTSISMPGVSRSKEASRQPATRRRRVGVPARPRLPVAGSAPNVGSPGSCSSSPPSTGRGRGALTRRRRPRAAGEQPLDHVLEVARGRLERLLEALADPAVGLADQAPQLGERLLQVLALRLELLDVRERLLVLALGERVHRAEPLAAALQPLEPCLELVPLLRRRAARRPPATRPRGRGAGRSARARRRRPARGRGPGPRAPLPA